MTVAVTPVPALPSIPARALRVGQRLGPYRLCLEIGTGGMATVFLAHREGVGGDPHSRWGYFAVKCVRPHLVQDPTFLAMFRDEARIASWIHHANVCSVFDFDVCNDTYYLAMEYLSGQTLKDVLRKLGLPKMVKDPSWHAGIVARIIADAAEGLHAAHELRDEDGQLLGVVHRDVSPENIFLTYDGNVKLMDFGLVRALGQMHETRTGIVKGKFGYVQPEVLQGRTPDRRADVWSLGVVLWELLTGRRLFAHDTEAAAVHAVATLEIPAPSKVREGVPRAIDPIVMRALSRDPDRRYPTARALARDLTRFIARVGHAIGLAEIADMMERMFPSGAECDRQLLLVAHQIEEASVAWELASPSPPSPSRSVGVDLRTSEPSAVDLRMLSRRPSVPLAAALTGGLLLGGAMTWSWSGRSESPPEPAQVVSASVQPSAALATMAAPAAPSPPPLAHEAAELPPPMQSAATPPEGARATASKRRASRIELLGQDDLVTGETLLRLRVVPDDTRTGGRRTRSE